MCVLKYNEKCLHLYKSQVQEVKNKILTVLLKQIKNLKYFNIANNCEFCTKT